MNPSRFSLVTLALIVSVVRAGSISGGAKRMNLALAAASKRIADFESYVGAPIFRRLHQGVELTDAGRAIFHNLLSILENVELLHRNIEELAGGGRSQVRIWVNGSAITAGFTEDLASFAQAHPHVSVELQERETGEIIDGVRENRADIGIFADSLPSAGLKTKIYREQELVLVVPAGHELLNRTSTSFAEALAYDFVGLLSSAPLSARIEYENGRLRNTPKFKIQVRGVETMCRMIAAGMGIGILPAVAARRHLKSMGLRSLGITDGWARYRLFIGYRDQETLPHAARVLTEYLCRAQRAK